MNHLYAWCGVLAVVAASTTGDVLLASAMQKIGDVQLLMRDQGLLAVIKRVAQTPKFFLGLVAMGATFYSLLFALSWGDVSFIVPASASLTFIANAVAAKVFLHERVDRRRWIAAMLVAGGVVLLAA